MFKNFRRYYVSSNGLRRSFVCVVALCTAANAFAYLAGGHYYTILAIHSAKQPETSKSDIYWDLEAFCAELPDMSRELDATTQRINVLLSMQELGAWGAFGSCRSPVSKHMVAVQFYLHGLTGGSTPMLREVAENLVATISPTDPKQPGSPLIRACAKGFAMHLLGDSYAHARLDAGSVLYPTGLGHFGPKKVPDFMQSERQTPTGTEKTWELWVDALARSITYDRPAEELRDLDNRHKLPPDFDPMGSDDEGFVTALIQYVQKGWNKGAAFLGGELNITKDVDTDQYYRVTGSCDDRLNTWKSAHKTNPILANIDDLSCAPVWKTYHAAARAAFAKKISMGENDGPGPSCNTDEDQFSAGDD